MKYSKAPMLSSRKPDKGVDEWYVNALVFL